VPIGTPPQGEAGAALIQRRATGCAQSSILSPGTRAISSRFAVTRTAPSARAWAAMAASKSSIRVPRRSSAALTVPKRSLTASVHGARASSVRTRSKRSSRACRRFDRGRRAMPYAISAMTGWGTATSPLIAACSLPTTRVSPFMRAETAFVSRTYLTTVSRASTGVPSGLPEPIRPRRPRSARHAATTARRSRATSPSRPGPRARARGPRVGSG